MSGLRKQEVGEDLRLAQPVSSSQRRHHPEGYARHQPFLAHGGSLFAEVFIGSDLGKCPDGGECYAGTMEKTFENHGANKDSEGCWLLLSVHTYHTYK